jgi:choline dehydrogenase-like flavoprotein
MRFDGGTDLLGMPRFELEYALSATNEAMLDRARDEHAAIFRLFGGFDPHAEAVLLPAGASLSPTGTVRAGAEDDGGSVTDLDGRVWSVENLYLAGNGVVPTAMAANTTLTATITAVCAARTARLRLSQPSGATFGCEPLRGI